MIPLVKSQRSTPRPMVTSAADSIALAHRRPAGCDVRQLLQPARRPLDGDGIRRHPAHMALQGHRHVLVIDLAFHEAIHRVQKILAVIAGVKSQDVRRQHVQQHLALPRTHAEGLGVRPGDVPEQCNRRLGYFLADQLRQQREMEILDQNHRAVGVRFRRHHLGELGVHLFVGAPVAGAKRRPHVGQMAQRPQPFIGKSVVVALFLFFGEPHPAQGVGRDRRAARESDRSDPRSPDPPCRRRAPPTRPNRPA